MLFGEVGDAAGWAGPWMEGEQDDHDEDDAEQVLGTVDALDDGEGGQHDRDGAAQPGPGAGRAASSSTRPCLTIDLGGIR